MNGMIYREAEMLQVIKASLSLCCIVLEDIKEPDDMIIWNGYNILEPVCACVRFASFVHPQKCIQVNCLYRRCVCVTESTVSSVQDNLSLLLRG